MSLHPKFYSGREMPQVHEESVEMEDWLTEQEEYCMNGFEYQGTRITGVHYFLLNFFPMMRVLDFQSGRVDWGLPSFAQEDDYIYKQSEEAYKSKMYTGLITARGYGKTYMALAEAARNYSFRSNSINLITASTDEPAHKTFRMLDLCLAKMIEPLRHNRLRDDKTTGLIESGVKAKIDNKDRIIGLQSLCRKVIYEDNPGKTRGDRPTFQLYEEIGSWTGSAKLKDCLAQSRGSFVRGSIFTASVWLIGTGGQMKTGGSEDAQEIFFNPTPHGVYACQEWYQKKTMIFMPAFKKYGGYFEATGISDEVGAKKELDRLRKLAEPDMDAYMQLIQEFPYEPKEAFITSGAKRFNQLKLQRQEFALKTKPENQGVVMRGRFWWIKKNNQVTGVEFTQEDNGPVQLLEEPEKDKEGAVYKNLYISGVDSVDGDLKAGALKGMRKDNHGEAKDISKLSFLVKKRFLTVQRTNNIYVCQITWRPENIDDAYEQVLMATIYYDMRVNVEHTKIGIIKYFQQKKALTRLFRRPGVCYQDVRKSRNTNEYGTVLDGAGKVIVYGLNSVSKYVEDFTDNIFFLDLTEELIKFDDLNRTKFDRVMAMAMTEIADDELLDVEVKESETEDPWEDFGYYTDKEGNKQFGAIPKDLSEDELFPRDQKSNDIFTINREI